MLGSKALVAFLGAWFLALGLLLMAAGNWQTDEGRWAIRMMGIFGGLLGLLLAYAMRRRR